MYIELQCDEETPFNIKVTTARSIKKYKYAFMLLLLQYIYVIVSSINAMMLQFWKKWFLSYVLILNFTCSFLAPQLCQHVLIRYLVSPTVSAHVETMCWGCPLWPEVAGSNLSLHAHVAPLEHRLTTHTVKMNTWGCSNKNIPLGPIYPIIISHSKRTTNEGN